MGDKNKRQKLYEEKEAISLKLQPDTGRCAFDSMLNRALIEKELFKNILSADH